MYMYMYEYKHTDVCTRLKNIGSFYTKRFRYSINIHLIIILFIYIHYKYPFNPAANVKTVNQVTYYAVIRLRVLSP